jgi:hypothetical protein
MALSRVIATGDGVTTQFAVSFALGYLSEDDIQCRVNNEEDGGGDPVYRDITFINPGLIEVSGDPAGDGERVEFTRTVASDELLVNWADGNIINDTNLNTAQKQALMLLHQLLDGRLGTFNNDLDMGGYKVTNLGDPTDAGDAVNLGYILDNSLDVGAAADAAAASAIAAALSASQALASKNDANASADEAAASEASVAADAAAAAAAAAAALVSENNAETAETNAESAQTSAAAAQADAEAAQAAAEAAQTAAESAQGDAQTFADDAEDARIAALAAQAAAEAALASTLAAYDSFDDRYLGAKASDPTLDNDGNALAAGMLYYNSTDGSMKLYNGSIWTAAYVSGGDFLATAGGTMTGPIVLAGNPASALHATPKQYVDTMLPLAGGTLTGKVNTVASDTDEAGINLAPGTAPTSPVNGDLWTTTSRLVTRLNGSTWTPAFLEADETVTGDWTFEGTLALEGITTLSAKLNTVATDASNAGLNVPHGTAPGTPVNGDIWSTTANLFARINGTTVTLQRAATTLAGYGITDGAAKTQTDFIGGFIEALDNQDYRLVVNAPYAGTITATTTRSGAGTATATFKINTTALGGSTNSISTTEQERTHASANAFVAGDDIVVTISSNSACTDVSFLIKFTRTLS